MARKIGGKKTAQMRGAASKADHFRNGPSTWSADDLSSHFGIMLFALIISGAFSERT